MDIRALLEFPFGMTFFAMVCLTAALTWLL